jgi:hypothetical protein
MAQIAIDTRRAPSGPWQRFAAVVAGIRARREQRRALVRLLSQWDSGIATGARGLTLESDPRA